MPKRITGLTVVLLVGSLMSGCAGVPITITAASYAVTGFSLLGTGKTPSDHVLSAALDQDCAVWRVMVQDRPICADDGATGEVFAEAVDGDRPKVVQSASAPTPAR